MSTAVFTIVRNESIYLPIWLNYYRQFFKDLFVLDHNSTDGSTHGIAAVVIPVNNSACFDHCWMRDKVQYYQKELLETYDTVIFTEVDEILWYPLGLDKLPKGCHKCIGYDLIQMPEEPELNLDSVILEQRQYWQHNDYYDKTLISDIPLNWELGFHKSDPEGTLLEGLTLIHLKKMDYELARQRNEERAQWNWSQKDLENKWGYHNRLTGEEFKKFFYNGGTIQNISEEIKKSIRF